MRDRAVHADQIDLAVAEHRREQGVARLGQGGVMGDQTGAAAADLLLVDDSHRLGPPRAA